jgi:serine protease Do
MKTPLRTSPRTKSCLFALGLFSLSLMALLPLSAVPAKAQDADIESLESLSRLFRSAYQQAAPGVVLIKTSSHRTVQGRRLPPSHPEIGGSGSGTIVSPDGYILSNYHVVGHADSIQVTLADRRTFAAQVVGFDSLIDIALLKVEANNLPMAQLGDSDGLQIGDWVLAIGHPLGMGSTLTHGIVSALNRQADVFRSPQGQTESFGRYSIESFIQTNAVINPGNSGGPLLDLHGRVIGINTAISTGTGYFIGYGLAVPINLAREAMRDLLSYGRVVRGYLGISMQEVDQQLIARQRLGLERPQGVFVDEVKPDGPASRGGLQNGDVLLEIDGEEVNRPNQVQTLIYARDPGENVTLLVWRDRTQRRLEVTLGELEDTRRLDQGRRRLDQLGFAVEPLAQDRARQLGFTPAVAKKLGFEQDDQAVVVVEVDPAGQAAARDINVDDVIAEIDLVRVTSVQAFYRSISLLKEEQAALFWLWRPGQGINMRALRIQSHDDLTSP